VKKFLIAGLVLCAVVAIGGGSRPALADSCYVVRATADARNPQISTERAERRLQQHILRQLTSTHGKHIGPVHTHCIRNACKASAVVCHHSG
jgi:hypothetical protein